MNTVETPLHNTRRFALIELEYAPNGFNCDEKVSKRSWCKEPAWIDFREDPESFEHTYYCTDHAPGYPDEYRRYTVYFDWKPTSIGFQNADQRRYVRVVARAESEALFLYRAFVDNSEIVGDFLDRYHAKIDGDDWNEQVVFEGDADEEDFFDCVQRAIAVDERYAAYFPDLAEA